MAAATTRSIIWRGSGIRESRGGARPGRVSTSLRLRDKERFREAIQHARWELDLLWRVHATFLVPLIFLLGFCLQASVSSQTIPEARSIVLWLLGLGILMCIPWWVIGRRGQSYYDFRIAQARSVEPDYWNLLDGDGEAFRKNHEIKLFNGSDEKKYRTEPIGRVLPFLKSRHASDVLVLFVVAMYLACFVLVLRLPSKLPRTVTYPLPVPSAAPYPFPVASPSTFPWPNPSPTDGKG